MCRYHHDLSDRNALPTNLKIKTRTMCILSAGVSFESDEYEIIRITTTRRVKILPLIDWLIVNWLLNVPVNFFIKTTSDVGEGTLLSNLYHGSDKHDIRDLSFFFLKSL